MSLVCRDGTSACTGCGMCSDYREVCDICSRRMKEGERYYRLSRRIICEDCTAPPEGRTCILCKRPATDGIRFKDIVLCRNCSGVATGYIGYI